MSSNLIEYMQV